MNFWFVTPVFSETRLTRGFGRVEGYAPTGIIENVRVLSSYANSSA